MDMVPRTDEGLSADEGEDLFADDGEQNDEDGEEEDENEENGKEDEEADNEEEPAANEEEEEPAAEPPKATVCLVSFFANNY